jgi:hypothetical protein
MRETASCSKTTPVERQGRNPVLHGLVKKRCKREESIMMVKQTLVAAAFGLLFAGNALAVNNGHFSGLIGWQKLGDVAVQSGAALMTTASATYEDDFPAAAGAFNVSAFETADAGSMVGFAGLQVAEALDLNGNFATEGSLLAQNISVNAGDIISFDWELFTNETGESAQPDYAFVVLDGARTVLAQAGDAATASSPYAFTTGRQTFTYTFVNPGSQRLAFGVVDVNDYSVTTALWLDNVSVTPVPEPKDWLLMLAGLGLVGVMVERTKRRAI